MASGWADNLKVVKVQRGETPKRVTLIVPYYDNPKFFRKQFDHWCSITFDRELGSSLWSVIVVDDGSPTYPAREALPLPGDVPMPWMRLFRIDVDVRWNWLAARNIGAHHASDGWLLLTDMDHVVRDDTLRSLIYGKHDPSVVYAFSRREHTGEDIQPHSASFFMARDKFWEIGGYDERCAGFYGSDGLYRRRVSEHSKIEVLTDELLRFEHVDDSSTTRYLRKQPEDVKLKSLVATFPKGSKPQVLSFPYHEVLS